MAYFQVAWAWCSDLSAPSVTAMGYWGQARVTGHEATRGTEQDRQIGTFALSRTQKLAKQPESTWTAYFQVAWAWCSDLSAPSVTAMGHWGQARVTGHEATRGTEQGRQIGTFALSRARKLAKRPETNVGLYI